MNRREFPIVVIPTAGVCQPSMYAGTNGSIVVTPRQSRCGSNTHAYLSQEAGAVGHVRCGYPNSFTETLPTTGAVPGGARIPSVFLSVSGAVAGGDARCGNMGCDVMRRYSFVSAVLTWTYALERYARSLLCGILADQFIVRDLSPEFVVRTVWQVSFKKRLASSPMTVSQLLEVRVADGNEEWMYALTELTAGDPQALWNKFAEEVMGELGGIVVVLPVPGPGPRRRSVVCCMPFECSQQMPPPLLTAPPDPPDLPPLARYFTAHQSFKLPEAQCRVFCVSFFCCRSTGRTKSACDPCSTAPVASCSIQKHRLFISREARFVAKDTCPGSPSESAERAYSACVGWAFFSRILMQPRFCGARVSAVLPRLPR